MCPPPPGPERRAPPHVEASGASGSGWPFPDARLGHSGLGGTNRSRAVARGRLAPTDHWGGRPAGRRTERRPPRCAQTLRLLRREPAGCRGTGSRGAPLRTQTPPPLPAAGHDPPLASLPEPCCGSGAGDEFRRAAGGAERSTSRTYLAELRRWAGPGRDPGALATPTRGGGASGRARGRRRSPATWVSAAHRASAGGGTRPPSPPGSCCARLPRRAAAVQTRG